MASSATSTYISDCLKNSSNVPHGNYTHPPQIFHIYAGKERFLNPKTKMGINKEL